MTREEAKEMLKCILSHDGEYMDYLAAEEVEAIKTLAEDPQTGEWKIDPLSFCSYCSVCKKTEFFPNNYCSYCGAKMSEKEPLPGITDADIKTDEEEFFRELGKYFQKGEGA